MKLSEGKGLNRNIDLSFSRRQTEIMRGVSIILIMLHNLIHLYPGVLGESEFNYLKGNISFFFDKLHHGSPVFISDMLSFLGWYGVPVFIFISGYGLTKRYDANLCDGYALPDKIDGQYSTWRFIRRNWIKLIKLVALGSMIFFSYEILRFLVSGGKIDIILIIEILIPVTCLNDLVQFWIETVPGVYWYIGLAFELYVIYALLVKGRSETGLWILTGICFFAFILFRRFPLMGTGEQFEVYMRHNFVGWMLPFACGISLARHPIQKLYKVIIVGIGCLILFIPAFKSVYTWQFTSVFAVGIIIIISLIFDVIPYWNSIWQQIGKISAFLYVVHPIVRHFTGFYTFGSGEPPTFLVCSGYILLSILGALLYRYLTGLIFSSKYHNRLFHNQSSEDLTRNLK